MKPGMYDPESSVPTISSTYVLFVLFSSLQRGLRSFLFSLSPLRQNWSASERAETAVGDLPAVFEAVTVTLKGSNNFLDGSQAERGALGCEKGRGCWRPESIFRLEVQKTGKQNEVVRTKGKSGRGKATLGRSL